MFSCHVKAMRFLFTCLSTQLVVQRLRWASHFHCHEKQITQSVQLVISTYKRCKITFNYINTCVLLKNIPHSWNLYETSSGYWVVYFSFRQSLYIDDVTYLFFAVFCAHSQLFYTIKLRGALKDDLFFLLLKTIFYPSKIHFYLCSAL